MNKYLSILFLLDIFTRCYNLLKKKISNLKLFDTYTTSKNIKPLIPFKNKTSLKKKKKLKSNISYDNVQKLAFVFKRKLIPFKFNHTCIYLFFNVMYF